MGTGLLGMLLVAGGTARAQDARDEARPPQQEEPKQEEARPEAKPQQDDAKPRQDEAKPPKEQAPGKTEDAKPAKNETQNDEMKQNDQMKSGKEENRPQEKGGNHTTRAAGQQGQKIPDDKFRSHFGRQHTFRVQTTVVEGQPRFQYSGYWFALANPWPEDWAYTDDRYVDYIDGEYVLIDLRHPGVEIPVIVVVG